MPKDTTSAASKASAKPSKAKPSAPVASSSKGKAAPPAKAAKPSADFDIDDIFAAPSTSALVAPPPPAASASSKKKKAKKPKADAGEGAAEGAKKVEPEVSRVQTVVDPSIGVGKKIEGPTGGAAELSEEMEAFKNSRGGGSESQRGELSTARERGTNVELGLTGLSPHRRYCPLLAPASAGRRTEEGFSIYKEDQLGINDDEGGGTSAQTQPVSLPGRSSSSSSLPRLTCSITSILFCRHRSVSVRLPML